MIDPAAEPIGTQIAHLDKIFDLNGNEVKNPDLESGFIVEELVLKTEVINAVNNAKQFAYSGEEEYIYVKHYHSFSKEEIIESLKQKLSDTDHMVMKVFEAEKTWEDYPGLCERRRNWRQKINALQKDNSL